MSQSALTGSRDAGDIVWPPGKKAIVNESVGTISDTNARKLRVSERHLRKWRCLDKEQRWWQIKRPTPPATSQAPTTMFSAPRRSQRTLLLLSVAVCVQIYSVLAKSSVLGDKPIYVSRRDAFRFRVQAEHLCHLIHRNRTFTLANRAQIGDRDSRMRDGAEPFKNKG